MVSYGEEYLQVVEAEAREAIVKLLYSKQGSWFYSGGNKEPMQGFKSRGALYYYYQNVRMSVLIGALKAG